MSDELKPGDVVRMKSGGPRMILIEEPVKAPLETVLCAWFREKDQTFTEDRLAVVSLKKVEDKEESDWGPTSTSEPKAALAGF